VADGAPTPSGGLPPSPARAGRDPSAGASRGSGGRAVVLVDCSGCRSRREASGPSRSPRGETRVEGVGSSHPASCSGGEGTSEAGSRRQSRENGGGLASIPEGGASRPAGEWALVEGRRPGSEKAVVFDEKAVEAGLAASPGGFGRKAEEAGRGRDRGRQRPRRKLGSRLKTPRPGGAARRSVRSTFRQDRAALPEWVFEAPAPNKRSGVASMPKLEARRQARLHPGIRRRPLAEGGSAQIRRPQGPREARSGIGQSVWVLGS